MRADEPLRLLLAAPASTGGIGRHVRTVAEGLAARGHTVTVCAPPATLDRLAPATGVRTVPMPLGTAVAGLGLRRLHTLTRAHDVTHAHGVRVGALLALAGGAPLVVTWHNAPLGPASRRVVHGVLERICARRADLVLGASADLVARAQTAGAAAAGLCAVAAPPLAGSGLAPADEAPERHPPTVLAIARLHPQKRLDLLVRAAATWPPTADRPQFLVAGDGPLLAALREQARATDAPVTFLGARDDVDALLAAADVVVLPSDWEARPLVAQEALRAGVPLVATDVGGVRELVGAAAVLVAPGDAAGLAAGIRRVLEDRQLRDELRRAGPARAAGWPTVEEMVDQLEATYLDLRSTVGRRRG